MKLLRLSTKRSESISLFANIEWKEVRNSLIEAIPSGVQVIERNPNSEENRPRGELEDIPRLES